MPANCKENPSILIHVHSRNNFMKYMHYRVYCYNTKKKTLLAIKSYPWIHCLTKPSALPTTHNHPALLTLSVPGLCLPLPDRASTWISSVDLTWNVQKGESSFFSILKCFWIMKTCSENRRSCFVLQKLRLMHATPYETQILFNYQLTELGRVY